MNLFWNNYKIEKPVRLIELFAGYGSQAMALKRAEIPFEHHFVCEFDKYAVKSYNAVHNTHFAPADIREIHASDLKITETDKYEYLMCYSFPCQDLSTAGRMAGMAKGSGTRSGLLWEVERILSECENLPQILLMENVKALLGEKNEADFAQWRSFLESLGYTSHLKVLNAKDFGVPQNRERVFMLSFLGGFDYEFPEKIPLKRKMKDLLEGEVAEKYFVRNERAERLLRSLQGDFEAGNTPINLCKSDGGHFVKSSEMAAKANEGGVAAALLATEWKGGDADGANRVLNLPIKIRRADPENHEKLLKSADAVAEINGDGTASALVATGLGGNFPNKCDKVLQIGNISSNKRDNSNCGRVYDDVGLSPSINANSGGGLQPHIVDKVKCLGDFANRKSGKARARENRDSVYDDEGLAPCLAAVSNNARPCVVDKVKCLGNFANRKSGKARAQETDYCVYDENCLSPTLRSSNTAATPHVIDESERQERIKLKMLGDRPYFYDNMKGTEISELSCQNADGDSNTITTNGAKVWKNARIRRLTPFECFRLMGVSDEDAKKMLEVNSESQCYKQAGNSIVVDVMAAMFRKLKG